MQRGKDGPLRTIVGVVRDSKEFSAEKEPPIATYYPSQQVIARNMFMVVRTSADAGSRLAEVTSVIQSIDPDLPLFDVKTMEGRLYDSIAQRRFAMLMLGVLAVIATLLAAVGIYGVTSYSVNQRTHEIGIRMALGARPASIFRLVVGQAMLLIGIGTALGLAGAYALTRVMVSLLFGVTATDKWTFLATPIVLVASALIASYLPARRAARVDPMIALRYE